MSETNPRRGAQLECLLLFLTFFGVAAHGQDIAAKKQPVAPGLSSLPMAAQARFSLIDPIIQLAELTASNGATDDLFGEGVAISGNTLVVGAPGDLPSGSAYVFVSPPAAGPT